LMELSTAIIDAH